MATAGGEQRATQPRRQPDLRILVTGFTCLLILLAFLHDLDISCFGFVAVPALVLTLLAMGLMSCGLAIYHAVRAMAAPTGYWRSIRLEVMHLAFVATLVLFHCSAAFHRVPDYVFVWRRLGALDAAVQQCRHGAAEAGGGIRYGDQVTFHYSALLSSFSVVHDPHDPPSGGEVPDSYWQSFPDARARARHLWGPWWIVVH